MKNGPIPLKACWEVCVLLLVACEYVLLHARCCFSECHKLFSQIYFILIDLSVCLCEQNNSLYQKSHWSQDGGLKRAGS